MMNLRLITIKVAQSILQKYWLVVLNQNIRSLSQNMLIHLYNLNNKYKFVYQVNPFKSDWRFDSSTDISM